MPSATHVNLHKSFFDEVEIRKKLNFEFLFLKNKKNLDGMSKNFKNNPKRSIVSKFTQL